MCSDSNNLVTAFKLLYVDFPHLAMIRQRSEKFGTENVTITLEWLPLESGIVSYDVSIIPPSISMTWLAGNTSIQVLLLYNTPYYLSVDAILCEQTSRTTITRLSYGVYSTVYRIIFWN